MKFMQRESEAALRLRLKTEQDRVNAEAHWVVPGFESAAAETEDPDRPGVRPLEHDPIVLSGPSARATFGNYRSTTSVRCLRSGVCPYYALSRRRLP
jgi:hypothetical protein